MSARRYVAGTDSSRKRVSLRQLSAAIGLEKASLYHRYPCGKDEIVLAVVARVARRFGEHVFAPLKTAASPRARVAVVAKQLRVFYSDGTKPVRVIKFLPDMLTGP